MQQVPYGQWIPVEWWETAQEDCDAVGEFIKHNYLLNPVRNYLRTHNLKVISRAEFSTLIGAIMDEGC